MKEPSGIFVAIPDGQGKRSGHSWWNERTYGWATSIFKLGAAKPLNLDDIPALEKEFTAEEIYRKFEEEWKKEVASGNKKSHSAVRVIRTIWRAFKYDYMLSGFYLVIYNLLNIFSPLVLQVLLNWLSNPIVYTDQADATIWQPYVTATGLFLMQLLSTFYSNWQYELAFKTGFKIRTALTMAIYRKSFVLSGKARQTYSSGKIVNISTTG